MARASSSPLGFPRISPSRTTTVSAPMTRVSGSTWPGDPTGLLPGENLHQVPGIPALERGFVNLRRLCGKFQSHLPQQLTAAGGLGR